MTLAKAADFWREVAASVARGERALVVAEDERGVDHRHRAGGVGDRREPAASRRLAKMLVHRRARRLGVGAAVLQAAEDAARDAGRTLLVLDTASDEAERLYERGGWQRVGTIPDYRADARRRALRHGRLLQKAGLTRSRRVHKLAHPQAERA